MAENNTVQTISELMEKIKTAKSKLVVVTFGERIYSPFLSRRQYKMKVFHNYYIDIMLEKAQRVFEESSTKITESIENYTAKFCD
ncbi:MAG: hypothetical protein QXT13_10550, partial [Pyrobaculum sp.]